MIKLDILTLKEKLQSEIAFMLNNANKENIHHERLLRYNCITDIINLIHERYGANFDVNIIKTIIHDINKYLNTGILGYFTFDKSEFNSIPVNGKYLNLRYDKIYKLNFNDNIIYNGNAYNVIINRIFNFKTKEKFNVIDSFKIENNPRIYLTNGGYVTDEYIETCIIPESSLPYYTLQSILSIDADKIIDGEKEIICIKFNHPKLKILKEFYNVEIKNDPNMLNEKGLSKYNIRNFIEK